MPEINDFLTFINDPNSTKIVLFELDISTTVDFWINDSPGVWKFAITNKRLDTQLGFEVGAFCYGNFKFNGIQDTGSRAEIRRVGSFTVAGESYTNTTNLSDCKKNPKSFFYDSESHVLYVNFFDNLPWNLRSVRAGLTYGFSVFAKYLDDIYYDPRIKSVPQISIALDDLFYGIRRYSFGSISFSNEDGFFDTFINTTVFGQECRVKLGGTTAGGVDLSYNDYITLYTGYVQSFSTTPSTFTITLGDKKDKTSRSIPTRYFSTATYPDIKTANGGKPIPLAWGDCRNVPCICVNESESPTPGNYTFVIADITNHSIKTLSSVYIDGVAQSTPSLTNDTTKDVASFIIASGGNYTPGKSVTADITGYDDSILRDGSGGAIEDALDIVEDIFNIYLSIPYNDGNFDRTRWDIEKTKDYEHGIYINENKKVSAILETIAVGHLGVFYVNGIGRWVFKTLTDNVNPVLFLGADEIMDEPKKIDDGKKYLTAATIKYNRDYGSNDFSILTDDSEQPETFSTFGVYRTQEFETYISTLINAQLLADKVLTEYKTVKSDVEIVTDIRAYNLQLYDIIKATINRQAGGTWLGTVKYRVMGIKYFLNNPVQIGLDLRYLEPTNENIVPDILTISKNYDDILVIGKISENDTLIIRK